MKRNEILLGFCVLGFAIGCTDKRLAVNSTPYSTVSPQSSVTLVSSVQFEGQQTVAQQMQVQNGSLYMTGRPFGFTRWEISPNPENPVKTFAISDNITSFSPMGAWVVDWYASGALAISGSFAFTSGTFGLSFINMVTPNVPVETVRKPPLDPNQPGVYPSDQAYVYQAIAVNPTLPYYYGFRQQDYVYTVNATTSAMTLVQKDAYGTNGQTVCCVTSATVFQNRVYVAFGDRLVIFSFAANGTLVPQGAFMGLQASYVTSSPNFMYVQHTPINSVNSPASSLPTGIYVFNASGQNIDRLDTGGIPMLRMAVSSDDTHIYANVDNQAIQIYRVNWVQGSHP